MKNWNRKRDIFIPDMHPPKTYECKVCGSKIVPNKNSRYVVKKIQHSVLTGDEIKTFDAFDCAVCGCQLVAKERLIEV